MNTYTYNPQTELDELGVPVHYLPLRDILAAWDAERRKVYCTQGLGPIQKRCALTHELAHISLGHHRCTYGGATNVATLAQERAAELWAARRLITVVQLAIASDSELPNSVLARELGVTPRIFRARILAEEEDEQRWLGPREIFH
ncbi:ImmA/IrrE family metallo-endopeptidase [Streptomyces sirii]|uniref:ImmA/IrrE family metallo-endopeptidase n=1 Tax=Streptomyces sirii TaxID=3127701 RepID=UPI003D35AC0F